MIHSLRALQTEEGDSRVSYCWLSLQFVIPVCILIVKTNKQTKKQNKTNKNKPSETNKTKQKTTTTKKTKQTNKKQTNKQKNKQTKKPQDDW